MNHEQAIEVATIALVESEGRRYQGMSSADRKMYTSNATAAVNAYLPALTVTTVEELEKLPSESNVWGSSHSFPGIPGTGAPYSRLDSGEWWDVDNGYSVDSDDIMLPATVLHIGGTQ